MILTEDEAKTKWCPDARGCVSSGHVVNRRQYLVWEDGEKRAPVPDSTLCLGSACMAWRWGRTVDEETGEPRGYCGKAGKS